MIKWKFNSSKSQRAVVYELDPELAKEKTARDRIIENFSLEKRKKELLKRVSGI